MSIPYPVIIKVSKAFLEELKACEYGRYEDALGAREEGHTQEVLELYDYDCVFCDFADRWKTQIECRNDKELAELYYVCVSGTIRINGFVRTADRVALEIRPLVETFDPELVRSWR